MAKQGDVGLGDEAKDTITGLSGVVVAITDWLNGCQRISIQPRELKDGRPVDNCCFDVEQVEVTKSARQGVGQGVGQRIRRALTGGPHDAPTRNTDPR